MDKMKLESADITSQNIEKIAELFPNCITETKDKNGNLKKAINFELLKQDLSKDIVDGKECYEFTWVGKKDSIIEANKPIRKTLRPCKEDSVNWDSTENLYIEGDNLEVLKLLQESYLGKVKMIYIDPPYNTGNDFIYPDDYKMTDSEFNRSSDYFDEEGNIKFSRTNSESEGKFHSDWCSMIYSRLMLARNLLSEDGVIFISIDDNEVENLKKIGIEIFGSENFITQLVWEKKKKGAFLSKNFINMKEYILVFSKQNISFNGLIGETVFSSETYPCIKTTNAQGIRIIRKGTVSKYKELNYTIPANTVVTAGNMKLTYLDDLVVKKGILQFDVRIDSNWIYSQSTLDNYAKEGLIYITQDNYVRRIVSEKRIKMLKDLLLRVGADNISSKSLTIENNLNNGGWGTNEDANEELHNLLNEQYLFDFSKPTKLIGKLILSAISSSDIVLDFFSGSSTTAHAVMQLNAEDGGNRKFIMVQLSEPCDEKSEAFKAGYKNICEIGKERIRRAAKKIADDNPNAKFDGGFRVFKVDDSNMKDVYYAPAEYSQTLLDKLESNIKEDRTDLDLFFGCILDWGLPLNLSYTSESIENCSVHTYSDNALIACFNDNIPESVIKEIAKKKPLRVVFRDSSFADTPSKINVTEIFKLLSPDTRVKVI
uniref:site-specific DNA-methyltransferase n=1 Tax=Succinivibrio sp. TaxID=2053619 RepID=UPI003FEFE7AD